MSYRLLSNLAATAILGATCTLRAAPVTEVSAIVDISRGTPAARGFVSMSLVNAEGLELVFPLRAEAHTPRLRGDARFASGIPIGNWEPSNIRYYRVTHHNAPTADWEASHVLITALTADGAVTLFDEAASERVHRLRRSFGGDLQSWLFEDGHRQSASAARAHVDFTFQGRMANGTFGIAEVEFADGRVLHHRVAPYRQGSWQNLRFDLPDGAGRGHIHRCRLLYHGGGSNEWRIASLNIEYVSPEGDAQTITWNNGVTLRGVEVFESARLGLKVMPDFLANRFLIELRTGRDDLRGRVDPRSELRVSLFLRDGREVLLHTPLIEHLNDHSSQTIEVRTEDGSGIPISEIESYAVHAVRLGSGGTWPGHDEDPAFRPNRIYGVDPFRQDDNWLLEGASLSATPLGATLQVSLPPPVASVAEVVPGHSNDVRLLPTPVERRLGYDPHPAWFRLETNMGLDRLIRVNPRVRANGRLALSQPRVYWSTSGGEEPGERDQLRDVLFPVESTSEAIVAGGGKKAATLATQLLGGRPDRLEAAPRNFKRFRAMRSGNMEFRLLPDTDRDSDGDGSSDAEAYAFGLEAGEKPELRLERIGAKATILYRRADRVSDFAFRVLGSGDGRSWRELEVLSENVLGQAGGESGTEWVRLRVAVPRQWKRGALFKLAADPRIPSEPLFELDVNPEIDLGLIPLFLWK